MSTVTTILRLLSKVKIEKLPQLLTDIQNWIDATERVWIDLSEIASQPKSATPVALSGEETAAMNALLSSIDSAGASESSVTSYSGFVGGAQTFVITPVKFEARPVLNKLIQFIQEHPELISTLLKVFITAI